MTRNNFFRALATVIFAPSILKDINWEEGQKCMFDEKKLNERLDDLRKYPLTESECHPPEWAYYYCDVTKGKIIRFKTQDRILRIYNPNQQT